LATEHRTEPRNNCRQRPVPAALVRLDPLDQGDSDCQERCSQRQAKAKASASLRAGGNVRVATTVAGKVGVIAPPSSTSRACTHKSTSHGRFRANRTIWVRGKESALLLMIYGERCAAVTTPW